jgi:hypothetical protein
VHDLDVEATQQKIQEEQQVGGSKVRSLIERFLNVSALLNSICF